MKLNDKAHTTCEFVAVLKLWDVCVDKTPEWTKCYLKNMAIRARRYEQKRKP